MAANNYANPTYVYVGAFVEELTRSGLSHVVICPGSRSTPLAMAFANNPNIRPWMHVDERSAAFFALGMAKRVHRAVAVVSTSGTAAANYLPAVIEAALAGAPLVVLTTDRPFELHYAKANQTLPQRDLFSPFAQAAFDIPAPEQRLFLHALLADLDQAVFEMQRTARPVHLNIAYRKPFVEETFTVATLPPEEVDELTHWSARSTPWHHPYTTQNALYRRGSTGFATGFGR